MDPFTIEFVWYLLFYTCLHVLHKILLVLRGILSLVLAYILGV